MSSSLSSFSLSLFSLEYDALTDMPYTPGGLGAGVGVGVGEGTDISGPTLAHVGDVERYYDLWKDKPKPIVDDDATAATTTSSATSSSRRNSDIDNAALEALFPFDEEAFVTNPVPASLPLPLQSLPPGRCLPACLGLTVDHIIIAKLTL